MFTANDEGMLSSLYEQAINMYNDSNSSIIIIIKLMEKQFYWAPYLIDQVKGIFGLR